MLVATALKGFFPGRSILMSLDERLTSKMSDAGLERALLGLFVCKSSQKWGAERSTVRSIAWLGLTEFTK